MHESFVDIKMEHDYDDFGFSADTPVRMGPIYSRPMQPSFSSPQPLPSLVILPEWPSQITNALENSSPPASLPLHRPILPRPKTAPDPTLALAPAPSKPSGTTSTSRRTLTDNDRQRMCEYHSENPNVKQTKIGAMFGVERSTVSKVLRNKEKHLSPVEGSRSPIRRSKSKLPDIERTLSQWAKNRLSQGLPLDGNTIRNQARILAITVGSTEFHNKVNDLAWLEHFKTENQLPGAISPKEEYYGSISSPNSPDSYMDGTAYGHAHSQSTASLNSCISDMSSFASDYRIPTSPFLKTSPDSATSKHLPQSTAASSLESPPEEMEMSPLSASEPARTRTTNPSPLSMALLSANTSPSIGSVTPSTAPSQDEARAALSTLMTFIKHQPNDAVDPHDYLVMAKWMHMLKLETGKLPGGMQAIPMSERADGTLPVGRKRSEHSLS